MPAISVEVERPQAEFASWYELFPRSQSGDPARHGTFDDVIARLPDIRQMGFDVLYFPPIHPIGMKHRKGRNNTPTRGARRSRQPLRDRQRRRAGTTRSIRSSARSTISAASSRRRASTASRSRSTSRSSARRTIRGCATIPDWFRWRPDGTIKYAENPPKKYQDIVNVDFYGGDPRRALDRAARHRAVLGRRGRAHLPRRQPAHQAAAVLAMDDRRRARPLSRRRSSCPRRSPGRR